MVVDRFFPLLQVVLPCGALQDRTPLNVRTWTCDCAMVHDRDVNAAKNLLAAGPAVSVCGAGARPQRRTPGGQSATKQRTPRREP
ncbi:transposase [Streptomyces sp. NBC_01549]|uniref:zinc ribbon domain-containing protein n=1 Tax=Streptomyces sp. NBC_01549 TaxID=2975874 RepID=UPI002253BF19|nr:zinc ribbon domain-containing protein [Streptomyces sp. NBC_01549]MCX4598738.1 transposase [Streptomyces sp. NBC_01549]